MHLRRRILALGLLAALALAGLAAAGAPQTYTLRLHDGTGDIAKYSFTATVASHMTGTDVPWKKVDASAQLQSAAEFLGVSPDGSLLVQGQVLGGTIKGSIDGKGAANAIEASSMNYILTPRAEVKELEVLSGTPAQTAIMGVAFTADNAFLPPPLPAGPIAAGGRWQSTAHVPVLMGEPGETKEVKYDSKVLGPIAYAGRNCLKIKSTFRQFEQATVEAPDGSGTLVLKLGGTGSIIWLFDPKEGLVMKSDSDSTLTITAVVQTITEGEQTVKGTGRVSLHAKMTEYNGTKLPAK